MGLGREQWLPTSRPCGCCGEDTLFARLAYDKKQFRKRVYTFICRRCDLGPMQGSTAVHIALLRAPPPPDHPNGN